MPLQRLRLERKGHTSSNQPPPQVIHIAQTCQSLCSTRARVGEAKIPATTYNVTLALLLLMILK